MSDRCMCCNSHNVLQTTKKSYFNLPVFKCNNCSTHFVLFDEKINLENFYKEEYWESFRKKVGKNTENKKTITLKIKKNILQTRTRILVNLVKMTGVKQSRPFSQYAFFKPYLQGHHLFEIGTGEGESLEFYEKNGLIVFGLEPSIKNVTIINKKLKNGKCEQGFIENNIPKKKFDVIVMSHVLEHLINPASVLLDLKNNLSENGILFIEVPNGGMINVSDRSIRNHPHVNYFTKLGLENLAENTNYKVLRIEFFHFELNSFLDFVRYGVYWIFKKDFFKSPSAQKVNAIRIILSNEKKNLASNL